MQARPILGIFAVKNGRDEANELWLALLGFADVSIAGWLMLHGCADVAIAVHLVLHGCPDVAIAGHRALGNV